MVERIRHSGFPHYDGNSSVGEGVSVVEEAPVAQRTQFTRARFLLFGVGFGASVAGNLAFLADRFFTQTSAPATPPEPSTESPMQVTVSVRSIQEFPLTKIVDRRDYDLSVNHLRNTLQTIINPDYIANHPGLFKSFDEIDSLSNDELQSRIIVRSRSENSQTGYQDGAFYDTRFLIRDESARALIGGTIDERDEYSEITAQLDRDRDLIPGHIDDIARFELTELEDVLSGFFDIPQDIELHRTRTNNSLIITHSQYLGEDTVKIYHYSIDKMGVVERKTEILKIEKKDSQS